MNRNRRDRSNDGFMRHSNRSKGGSNKDKHRSRSEEGTRLIIEDQKVKSENYNLGWFKPTPKQKDIVESMCTDDLIVVQGSSGTGKSTTAIWQGLKDLKAGHYDKIIFIKTASELGDDEIGALSGDKDQKLEAHFQAMRSIFHSFMSKAKLAMEEKRGNIRFDIPNYIAGETLSNALVILDESQLLSPKTTKLLLERAGEGTVYVVLGDKRQTYSKRWREDGFTDLVDKITEEDIRGTRESKYDTVSYHELGAGDNMRSALSKFIVNLYEVQED